MYKNNKIKYILTLRDKKGQVLFTKYINYNPIPIYKLKSILKIKIDFTNNSMPKKVMLNSFFNLYAYYWSLLNDKIDKNTKFDVFDITWIWSLKNHPESQYIHQLYLQLQDIIIQSRSKLKFYLQVKNNDFNK